jgi:predicted PurR-regulated permease PerM
MTRSARIAYILFAGAMFLIVWLNLGTFLLTALFGYLILSMLTFRRNKALSVALYIVAVSVIGSGLVYFASLAYHTLPTIAETSIPAMVGFAEKHGIDLPFTDYESLKISALTEAKGGITTIGRYLHVVSVQTILLLAGLAVALGIFLNPSWTTGNHASTASADIYSEVVGELGIRFKNLYRSFARVIGAQIVISAINTALTAIFLVSNGYPYSVLLVFLVFLCGMIPIVGNFMSNLVIVGVGFTMSPRTGILALVFLILIHKLEYFLDSKIIGHRIDNPMWLMLIGLVVGDRLMGVSGMVLAPVLLYYLKLEASTITYISGKDGSPAP